MSDEEIAAELAVELYENEEMADAWIENPEQAELRLFGIDGSVDIVGIVAFVRSKL